MRRHAPKSFSCVPLPGPQSSIDIEVQGDGSIKVDVGAEYGGSLSAAEARELADAICQREPRNVVFFPITPTCSNDGCERSPIVTVVVGVAGVQICLQCLPDNTPEAVLTLLRALEAMPTERAPFKGLTEEEISCLPTEPGHCPYCKTPLILGEPTSDGRPVAVCPFSGCLRRRDGGQSYKEADPQYSRAEPAEETDKQSTCRLCGQPREGHSYRHVFQPRADRCR